MATNIMHISNQNRYISSSTSAVICRFSCTDVRRIALLILQEKTMTMAVDLIKNKLSKSRLYRQKNKQLLNSIYKTDGKRISGRINDIMSRRNRMMSIEEQSVFADICDRFDEILSPKIFALRNEINRTLKESNVDPDTIYLMNDYNVVIMMFDAYRIATEIVMESCSGIVQGIHINPEGKNSTKDAFYIMPNSLNDILESLITVYNSFTSKLEFNIQTPETLRLSDEIVLSIVGYDQLKEALESIDMSIVQREVV